jgi:hypothetical protein
MKNNNLSPKISVVAPQQLKKNYTTHSMYVVPNNYEEIRDNIREFGLLNPLLINFDYEIISGNLRHQIALELGLDEVPVVFIDTPEEMKGVLAVSSNQFRTKTLVDIVLELRFYDDYYSLRRGERTDLNPQMKLVKDEKDNAYKKIGQYKINKLKSIENILNKIHKKDYKDEIFFKQIAKVDLDKISLNQLEKNLQTELLKKCNEVIVPEKYDLITENVKRFVSFGR